MTEFLGEQKVKVYIRLTMNSFMHLKCRFVFFL